MPMYYMGDMLPIKLLVIYNNRLSLFSILLRPFVVVVVAVVVGFDDVTVALHLNAVHRFLYIYICVHHHHHYRYSQFPKAKKHAFFSWPMLHVFTLTHKHVRRVTHTVSQSASQTDRNRKTYR